MNSSDGLQQKRVSVWQLNVDNLPQSAKRLRVSCRCDGEISRRNCRLNTVFCTAQSRNDTRLPQNKLVVFLQTSIHTKPDKWSNSETARPVQVTEWTRTCRNSSSWLARWLASLSSDAAVGPYGSQQKRNTDKLYITACQTQTANDQFTAAYPRGYEEIYTHKIVPQRDSTASTTKLGLIYRIWLITTSDQSDRTGDHIGHYPNPKPNPT